MTQDREELKRLAEAATPGQWNACGTIYKHMNCEVRSGAKGEGQAIGQIWDGPNAFKDGQFIAAANPSTILSLLSDIEAMQEALRPFALAMATLSSRWLDHETQWQDALPYPITVGDLRRARQALSKEPEA